MQQQLPIRTINLLPQNPNQLGFQISQFQSIDRHKGSQIAHPKADVDAQGVQQVSNEYYSLHCTRN